MKYKKYDKPLKTNSKKEIKIDKINHKDSKEQNFKDVISNIDKTNEKNEINKVSQNDISSQKENNFDIKEIIFNMLNKDKVYKIERFGQYFIREQEKVNDEYALTKKQNSLHKNNIFEKLVSLIARYSIIIHLLIQKNNLTEAKNLLLLMIRQNLKNIDSQTFRLFKKYNKLQQKYEIVNVYPKTLKELLKIYSLLIKYCTLFNLSNYKNMFLVRYLSLHSLNYKVFKRKFEIRGFSIQTRNELKYLFSLCLNYATFFTVKYFCPLKVPIFLSGLILKVYRNLDENVATKREKCLIINTLYNQSLFYYLNNQTDSALRNLRITKQKIVALYYNENIFRSRNEKKNSFWKNLFLGINSKEAFSPKNRKDSPFQSSSDLAQIFLNENPKKKNYKLEDMIDMFKLNNKTTIKKSNSLFCAEIKIKEIEKSNPENLNIPNYLKDPLFFKIELFMTEIEFDRKNYFMSYEHVKNCLLLILILNKYGDVNKNNENQKRLKIIANYLEQIKKRNKDKVLESRIKSLQNFNININPEKTDNLKEKNNKQKEIIEVNDTINLNNEIDKLFLFLSSLSLYQIKLFNDTQPNLDSRNDMPIFFSDQLKDSLTLNQRHCLDKLNIMSVSRSSLLLDTNKSILPSNLKIKYSNEKTKNPKQKKIQITFDGSLMNNNIQSITEENKENEKEKGINMDYSELKYLKKILLSCKKKNKLKIYLINNIYFVHKILVNSNNGQIEEMIKYPEIIIEPIKLYKKRHKFDDSYKIIQKDMLKKLKENPQFKSILNKEKNLSKKKKEDNKEDNKDNDKLSKFDSSEKVSYDINISTEEEQISSET